MKGQLRSRDQRALELQVETEQLREQAARQNAVIASLKKRIQVLCNRHVQCFLHFITLI
jgi:thiamine monophosphate synthase